MPTNDNNQQLDAAATEESFWSLLDAEQNEFSIFIPRIQRDYAQGRETPETNQIREQFLNDIFQSLETEIPLDINFIYGNVESKLDSKGVIIKRKFTPIDGQQRLTTLFLLHWYFASFSGRIASDERVKQRLLQFQYETRFVTGQFCEHLIKDVSLDLKQYKKERRALSSAIMDYYWFFSNFSNDATIRSMLVMLDAIHKKAFEYSDRDLEKFFELLISDNSPIRFLYLDLGDLGLTDSIYIKMNARGKALTHFENFKAQLNSFLEDGTDFSNEFIGKINGKWSEFFWNPEFRKLLKNGKGNQQKRETLFDDQMMKFFRFVMRMDYIIRVDDSNIKGNQQCIRDAMKVLLTERDYVFTSRLFKDSFKNVVGIQSTNKNVDASTFKKIYKLLNILEKRKAETGSLKFADTTELKKSYIDEDNAFIRLIGVSEERGLTNEEQIILFSEYAFLIKYANKDDSFDKGIELNRWLRVVYNLTGATLNLQLDVYFRNIRSLNYLVDNGYSLVIREYMAGLLKRNYRQSPMFSFFEEQVNEESIKSLLLLQNNNWNNVIVEAENSFMDGQIGSLVSFSGLFEKYYCDLENYEKENETADTIEDTSNILDGVNDKSDYFNKFNNYLHKFEMIFNKNGLKPELEDRAIFRRALLTFGGELSYMLPPKKAVQSFLDNNDRDYGFKRLLRDENDDKRAILKELLDQIDETKPIVNQMESIISKATFTEENRWKKYFVEMPEILDSMYKNDSSKKDPSDRWVFENTQRFICKRSNDHIYLLTKKTQASVNRELYSYVLYLKAIKEGLAMKYKTDYSEGAEKYAYYKNKQGQEIQVIYQKRDELDHYEFYARTDTGDMYNGDMNQMMDYIKKTISLS